MGEDWFMASFRVLVYGEQRLQNPLRFSKEWPKKYSLFHKFKWCWFHLEIHTPRCYHLPGKLHCSNSFTRSFLWMRLKLSLRWMMEKSGRSALRFSNMLLLGLFPELKWHFFATSGEKRKALRNSSKRCFQYGIQGISCLPWQIRGRSKARATSSITWTLSTILSFTRESMKLKEHHYALIFRNKTWW